MEDKFEFDETEIRRIPDKVSVMELGLSWKHYGGWVHCVFSLLLFSGIAGVICYSLISFYKLNSSFASMIALFIGCFLWAVWRKRISNVEMVCFFLIAVLGGSGEEHLKLLLDGNLIIIKYIAYSIMGIITGVKLGLTIVNKEAREVFKSRLMIVIFSLFFCKSWILTVSIITNDVLYRFLLHYFIFIVIGFFVVFSLKKISYICLIFIFIFSVNFSAFKNAFLNWNIASWIAIFIIIFFLFLGELLGLFMIKTKQKYFGE